MHKKRISVGNVNLIILADSWLRQIFWFAAIQIFPFDRQKS